MIIFNPATGGHDVVQDTPPHDGMGLVFSQSVVADMLGSVPQRDSESSTRSFMEAQFRMVAENMHDAGLLFSTGV